MVAPYTPDPYTQAALDEITAHPNDVYTVSPNVWAKLSGATNGNVPSNAQFNPNDPENSVGCQLFGKNCVTEEQFTSKDCPSYVKALSLCKAFGYVDTVAYQKAKDQYAQQNLQDSSSSCEFCDKVSAWFGKVSSRIVVVIVGFVLLYGAFLVYKK